MLALMYHYTGGLYIYVWLRKNETITDTIKMLCGYSTGQSLFVVRSKVLHKKRCDILWVWPPPRIPVTTRITIFLVGNPYNTFIYHCYWEGATPKTYSRLINFLWLALVEDLNRGWKVEGVCRWLEEAITKYCKQRGFPRASFINAGGVRKRYTRITGRFLQCTAAQSLTYINIIWSPITTFASRLCCPPHVQVMDDTNIHRRTFFEKNNFNGNHICQDLPDLAGVLFPQDFLTNSKLSISA